MTFATMWQLLNIYCADDTEVDLCASSNDSSSFWGLWRREVRMEIWVTDFIHCTSDFSI